VYKILAIVNVALVEISMAPALCQTFKKYVPHDS
jgi:hypothetical protein